MKKIFTFLFILYNFVLSTSAWCGNIVYPWRATTAIVKSGQSFEVWFNASSGQTVNSIQLKSAYITVSTTMSSVDGNWTYDPLSGNTYNKKITVTVPSTAPADRYDLVLVTSSGNVTSYGGVKVIKDYKADYYIMHWSDGHVYQSGYDTTVLWKRKSTMIDIANIIDAEIIIETGDNMYNVRNHPDREGYYFIGHPTLGTKGMAKANAATFLVPGDHEGLNGNDFTQATVQENSDFFNDYWGMQFHCFKYGNGRFMNLNNAWGLSATSNGVHQYEVDNALAWLNGDGTGGNFLVTAGHCYDRMHKFINDVKPLDLVLAGDKHFSGPDNPWEITVGGPAIAYIVNSIRDNFKFNIYKVNNNTGTFTKPAGTTAMIDVLDSGDINTPSTWAPNLKLTFANSNSGTSISNTATIVNRFAFGITGAKVRFVMPQGNTYTVTGGSISQEFDGTTYHIVDVTTDLNANSTNTITINKVADPLVNGAAFVSQSGVPSTMTPGQTATVSVIMKNTGTTTWTSTDLYKLGSQPGGSSTWGFTRVNLGTSDNIAPNATKTFSFTITAPTTAGTYNFQTKMVQENVEWFGDTSTNVAIVVAPAGNALTVTNGTGDGTYTSGTVVSIAANAPASGKVFNKWTINSGAPSIADLYDATTTLTMPATAAAVTATYSNYLDACDAITGWNTSATLYTTDKKEGTGCLQSVGSTTDEFKKAFTTAFNPNIPAANASLKFWYYVSDVTKFNSTNQVELGSGGAADANEYNWSLTGLVNGWNRIDLKISSANVVGSPNLNAINWFRIYHQKNGSVTTRVDAIEISGITSSSKSGHLIENLQGELNVKEAGFRIYPNPVNSLLYIGGVSETTDVAVINIYGQIVLKTKTSGSLDVSILAPGVYFLSISGDKPIRFVKN